MLSTWTTWVGAAIAVEILIHAPFIGETVTTRYTIGAVTWSVVLQIVAVGGCMFRAGMLYAPASSPVVDQRQWPHEGGDGAAGS